MKYLLDIDDKTLLFYDGEVHTNHICSILAFNNRRYDGRK